MGTFGPEETLSVHRPDTRWAEIRRNLYRRRNEVIQTVPPRVTGRISRVGYAPHTLSRMRQSMKSTPKGKSDRSGKNAMLPDIP